MKTSKPCDPLPKALVQDAQKWFAEVERITGKPAEDLATWMARQSPSVRATLDSHWRTLKYPELKD